MTPSRLVTSFHRTGSQRLGNRVGVAVLPSHFVCGHCAVAFIDLVGSETALSFHLLKALPSRAETPSVCFVAVSPVLRAVHIVVA